MIEYNIYIITDYKALEFFKTQLMLTAHQHWWMDYLLRFMFNITYIKGNLNKVTDCLSWYYKSDMIQDIHQYDEYIQADAHIDPAGKDLPAQQYKEITERVIKICAIKEDEHCCSTHIHERKEQRDIEAEEMAQAESQEPNSPPAENPNLEVSGSSMDNHGESETTLTNILYDRLNNATPERLADHAFKQRVIDGYQDHKSLSLVTEKPNDYPGFTVWNNLVWRQNLCGDEVLCLPRDRKLLLELLIQAYEMVGHFGHQQTDEYIWQ